MVPVPCDNGDPGLAFCKGGYFAVSIDGCDFAVLGIPCDGLVCGVVRSDPGGQYSAVTHGHDQLALIQGYAGHVYHRWCWCWRRRWSWRWCRIRCRLWRWAGSWLRCRWIVLSAAGIASITAGIVIFRTGAASGAVVGRRAGVCIGIFGRVCFAVYIVSVGAFRDWIGGNPDAGRLDAALNVFLLCW